MKSSLLFFAMAWSSFSGLLPAEVAGHEPISAPPADVVLDPLVALNNASRAIYARSREVAIARSEPIILLQGDMLVLRNDGQRKTASIALGEYDELKTFAHVVLAIDAALIAEDEHAALSAEVLADLQHYQKLIAAAGERIGELGLSEEQTARQRQIVKESLAFIDQLRERGRCSVAQRQAFIRRLTPLVMANTADAAWATLNAIDGAVRQWQRELPPAEWNKLKVVVMGKQLPRKDSLAMQYFARLLNVPGECERLIYAESISEEPKALILLGTHVLDTQIGIDFFDDPMRMHRDILGDAAKKQVPALFERDRSQNK